MPPLTLQKVTKKYGNTTAVNKLDLHIREGELLALLGPSGCGKTTTIRLIAGLERPDAGEVKIGDKTVSSANTFIAPDKRGVGMVFQDRALWPHMTVGENISFVLSTASVGNKKDRLGELLRVVKLQGFEDKMPSKLSGGEQQRVAIARALASKPRILLLDEPLSNLDVVLRDELLSEIKNIHQTFGTTTVYVTHNPHEAFAIADKIVVMNNGSVEQAGTAEEIITAPKTEFVRRLASEKIK